MCMSNWVYVEIFGNDFSYGFHIQSVRNVGFIVKLELNP